MPQARLTELEEIAQDEGFTISPESQQDLFAFFAENPGVRVDGIFLLDNGCLRATWGGLDSGKVSLRFLGDGQVQFICYRGKEETAYGRTELAGVTPLLKFCGMFSLLKKV